MVKTSLITTLGTSPPVVTEFVRYMQEAEKTNATDLTIVTTQEKKVLEGLELVKQAIKDRYPNLRQHIKTLPIKDVATEEENYTFMKFMAQLLTEQQTIHRVDSTHLSLAGGRKDMSITAALLAQYLGVNGIYHIVMPNIDLVNMELEQLRPKITELANSQDKQAYYQQHKNIFEPLLYPPFHQYRVIKIPIIPYPKTILRKIHQLLAKPKTEKPPTGIPIDVIDGMAAAGLIRVTSKGTIYTLEHGQKIHQILSDAGVEKLV
jgi:CRISPR-associated protein Csx14